MCVFITIFVIFCLIHLLFRVFSPFVCSVVDDGCVKRFERPAVVATCIAKAILNYLHVEVFLLFFT
jgi:hypothetical protein